MFVSDTKMRSLNREWRSINKSTDVLSFPIHEVRIHRNYLLSDSSSLDSLANLKSLFFQEKILVELY